MAMMDAYSVPCAPETNASVGPGFEPLMTMTARLAAASTPAGTARAPVAFSPGRAVAVPTVTSAANAAPQNANAINARMSYSLWVQYVGRSVSNICGASIGCLIFFWSLRCFAQDQASFNAIDLNAPAARDKLAAQLATKRVVFAGEIHDRYDHHLNQLEIIKLLHAVEPNLAIGVEYFEQPFQAQVDDYIAGRTSEQEFLRSTEYFKNWRFDYRLYAPIFRYARAEHIPVRALNVPDELPAAVARSGISGLTEKQKAYLPTEREPADAAYRARLREAFAAHGPSKPGDFDHFVEAQLVWDEGMAESAATYLNAHPESRMVILTGSGHVAFGSGIPKRLERRTHASYAILLSSGEAIEPHMADYLLLSEKQDLPAAGVLGAGLQAKNGEVQIRSLSPGGAAGKSGLKKGDALAAIDGQTVKEVADVRLKLWDKRPGDRVQLKVRHGRGLRDVTVELTAPAGGPD